MLLQLVHFGFKQNCWDCKWCCHEGWRSNMSGHLARALTLALALAPAPALVMSLDLGAHKQDKTFDLLLTCTTTGWTPEQSLSSSKTSYTKCVPHTQWNERAAARTCLDLGPGQQCKKCQLCHRPAPKICLQPQTASKQNISAHGSAYFCLA